MYCSVFEIIGRLFRAYGGFCALIKSPYVHAAAIMSFFSYYLSSYEDVNHLALAIVPSVLGFSIGAYAIIFGMLGENILSIISEKEKGKKFSDLTILSSSFAWFVLMQAFAIITAILIKIYSLKKLLSFFKSEGVLDALLISAHIFNIISNFLFFYAMILSIAIVLEIFRLSTLRES